MQKLKKAMGTIDALPPAVFNAQAVPTIECVCVCISVYQCV